jgi:hypothetical protein
MADKKGVILIRFPEALADKLRRVSFELNIPIKDIVSQIVEKNLDAWFAETAMGMMDTVKFSTEGIRAAFSKISGDDFAAEMSEKLDSMDKSREYIRQALQLVKHGVLPAEAVLDAPSRESPSPAEPEQPDRPSSARRKRKAP